MEFADKLFLVANMSLYFREEIRCHIAKKFVSGDADPSQISCRFPRSRSRFRRYDKSTREGNPSSDSAYLFCSLKLQNNN